MLRVSNSTISAVSAVVLACGASSVSAATLTFDSWLTTTDNPVIDSDPTVVVDDAATANNLTFTVSIPFANAELSGVWLDLDTAATFSVGDFTSLTTGVTIDSVQFNVNDLGNGINLSGDAAGGSSAGVFFVGLRFDDGENGGAGRQIELPLTFAVNDQSGTLGLGDVERVGLRFQSVGTLGVDGLGGGSEKLVSAPLGDSGTVIPLPAAGWLLLAGIGGLAAMARRKKAAA